MDQAIISSAIWLNPPKQWSIDGQVLTARSDNKTDFWQDTYYGFHRDDGHAFLTPVGAAFSATLQFEGRYEELYDQAGLMVRWNPTNWVKFGIEWTDGAAHLSCVVTNGVSDWSAFPFELAGSVSLRMTSINDALLLQYLGPSASNDWRMARLAPLPRAIGQNATVGPYLCSPERSGFEAHFTSFTVTEPLVKTLHTD